MTLRRAKQSPKRAPFRANRIGGANFVIGAETSNTITVNVQLLDENLRDLAVRGHVHFFLSDDANGDTLSATAATAITAGTDGWLTVTTAGKAGQAVSEANGDLDIAVNYTVGAKTWYLGILLPDGGLVMSGALAFT